MLRSRKAGSCFAVLMAVEFGVACLVGIGVCRHWVVVRSGCRADTVVAEVVMMLAVGVVRVRVSSMGVAAHSLGMEGLVLNSCSAWRVVVAGSGWAEVVAVDSGLVQVEGLKLDRG